MDNKPTNSEQEEAFNKWLELEVAALKVHMMERGNLPAQGAYIMTVALASMVKTDDVEKAVDLPLSQIGGTARPQAMQQFQAAQIIN